MQIQTIQRISIHFAANSQKKPLNWISLTPQNRKLGHYTAPSTDNIVSTIPTTKKHSNKIKKRNPYPIKRLQQSIIISHRHLQIKSAHHHFTPASPRTSTSLQPLIHDHKQPTTEHKMLHQFPHRNIKITISYIKMNTKKYRLKIYQRAWSEAQS